MVAQLVKEVTTTNAWVQRTYDVSAYAGKTVWLYFGVHANGSSSYDTYQYIDDVSISGGAATPSPSASPTGSPTAKPTATPTAKPTATPTPAANPCLQTQRAGQASSVSVVAYTTVTNAISSGRNVCLSAYVFTSAMFTALDSAAKSGAKVTVVLPNEEKSSDTTDATQLQTDGATIVWDPGSPNDHPLHAKLAIVDGAALPRRPQLGYHRRHHHRRQRRRLYRDRKRAQPQPHQLDESRYAEIGFDRARGCVHHESRTAERRDAAVYVRILRLEHRDGHRA